MGSVARIEDYDIKRYKYISFNSTKNQGVIHAAEMFTKPREYYIKGESIEGSPYIFNIYTGTFDNLARCTEKNSHNFTNPTKKTLQDRVEVLAKAYGGVLEKVRVEWRLKR